MWPSGQYSSWCRRGPALPSSSCSFLSSHLSTTASLLLVSPVIYLSISAARETQTTKVFNCTSQNLPIFRSCRMIRNQKWLTQWCFLVFFPGECQSQDVVEESELTRCIEDVYKVRTNTIMMQLKFKVMTIAHTHGELSRKHATSCSQWRKKRYNNISWFTLGWYIDTYYRNHMAETTEFWEINITYNAV